MLNGFLDNLKNEVKGSDMMRIKLINRDNIKEIEYSENTKIGDILKKEQIPIESVVVKQDGETVSEKEFVKDGSEIEIIKVIYGG